MNHGPYGKAQFLSSSRYSSHFMETEISLPRSKEPAPLPLNWDRTNHSTHHTRFLEDPFWYFPATHIKDFQVLVTNTWSSRPRFHILKT